MDEQAKQVANFLLGLLNNNTTIPASQAENVVGAKQWLYAVAQGQLKVDQAPQTQAPKAATPVAPVGDEGEGQSEEDQTQH
jgi:hypothetical protein